MLLMTVKTLLEENAVSALYSVAWTLPQCFNFQTANTKLENLSSSREDALMNDEDDTNFSTSRSGIFSAGKNS